MSHSSDIVPITALCRDAKGILKKVSGSKNPIVITQRGKSVAILMSVDKFERSRAEFDILKMLVKGREEVIRGNGHALRDVLKDADKLLGNMENRDYPSFRNR